MGEDEDALRGVIGGDAERQRLDVRLEAKRIGEG